MKTKLSIVIFSFAFISISNACDICGSSMGGTNMGILPQFYKNFIGINYSFKSFLTDHTTLGSQGTWNSTEFYQRAELRSRFYLGKKVQLFTFIPFTYNTQNENDLRTTIKGFGDASVLINYNVFVTADSTSKDWRHSIQLGGGVKLPTGRYNKLNSDAELNPNIQAGSGSYDLLADLIYTIRYKKWGMNINGTYNYNMTNPMGYRFGDKVSIATSFFYWGKANKIYFLPYVGMNYYYAFNDYHDASRLSQSGGTTMSVNIGLDTYLGSWTVRVRGELPVYQTNPVTKSGLSLNVGLLYNFKFRNYKNECN